MVPKQYVGANYYLLGNAWEVGNIKSEREKRDAIYTAIQPQPLTYTWGPHTIMRWIHVGPTYTIMRWAPQVCEGLWIGLWFDALMVVYLVFLKGKLGLVSG